jgi:hypothetical protein
MLITSICATFIMDTYEHQVGGHLGTLYKKPGHRTIFKPCNEREAAFYLAVQDDEHDDLRQFMPSFHGVKEAEIPGSEAMVCLIVELIDII